MKVLVVGSIGYDDVETPVGKREAQLGGSVSYFSVAASYFTDVAIVSIVGEDFTARDRNVYLDRDIDIAGIEVEEGDTFRWSGSYVKDINNAETVDAKLNVFADFQPTVPQQHIDAPYLFLANCDPETQQSVLDQMTDDLMFVAGDTMNHWINEKRAPLTQLMESLDMSIINDGEAQLLTGRNNLVEVAETILDEGPRNVVIKRGEFGAALFGEGDRFVAPAFPVDQVIDPTGAGDSFAGGFMGYVAASTSYNVDTVRRAIIAGTIIASFTVEGFGLERLTELTNLEIQQRFDEFAEITNFDTSSRLPLKTKVVSR